MNLPTFKTTTLELVNKRLKKRLRNEDEMILVDFLLLMQEFEPDLRKDHIMELFDELDDDCTGIISKNVLLKNNFLAKYFIKFYQSHNETADAYNQSPMISSTPYTADSRNTNSSLTDFSDFEQNLRLKPLMQELKFLQKWKIMIGTPAVHRVQFLENEIKANERRNSGKSEKSEMKIYSKTHGEDRNLHQTTHFVQKRLQTTIDELKFDVLQLRALNRELRDMNEKYQTLNQGLVIKLEREIRKNKSFVKSCSVNEGSVISLKKSSTSQTLELANGRCILPSSENDVSSIIGIKNSCKEIEYLSQGITSMASMFLSETNDYQIISHFPMVASKIPVSTFNPKSIMLSPMASNTFSPTIESNESTHYYRNYSTLNLLGKNSDEPSMTCNEIFLNELEYDLREEIERELKYKFDIELKQIQLQEHLKSHELQNRFSLELKEKKDIIEYLQRKLYSLQKNKAVGKPVVQRSTPFIGKMKTNGVRKGWK